MSLILDLRGRVSHGGIPLVHPTSEHVVLANVFGIVKNLRPEVALNPWLTRITNSELPASNVWRIGFWEKQSRPEGTIEGSTEVDLVLDSSQAIVFVEVKMDTEPSAGTKADPERNQLIRNLDVGYRRASNEKKLFALIYVTPHALAPEIVPRIRQHPTRFAANPGTDSRRIAACLHWSSWGDIGDVLARSYAGGKLGQVEQRFALDLLSYLASKGLWKNTLPDNPFFYPDKLYRSLRRTGSPFIPYSAAKLERYHAWRTKPWEENKLRGYIVGLRAEDKALLKIMAEAGGALQQHAIMGRLPFLRGKTSASLRALKSHINAGCKQHDCAEILSEGSGSRDWRVHEISRNLGELRNVVIEVAKGFDVPWHLLERSVVTGRESPAALRSES